MREYSCYEFECGRHNSGRGLSKRKVICDLERSGGFKTQTHNGVVGQFFDFECEDVIPLLEPTRKLLVKIESKDYFEKVMQDYNRYRNCRSLRTYCKDGSHLGTAQVRLWRLKK